MFSANDYALLHYLVFQSNYPGYKPNVVESPNGDGMKDEQKKYAHVAEKYLNRTPDDLIVGSYGLSPFARNKILQEYFDKAHEKAMEVAVSIGIPPAFWPSKKYSALRVLEYGPTATTAPHTDFDLFTLSLYRNFPEYFKYIPTPDSFCTPYIEQKRKDCLKAAQKINAQIHFGELMEEIDPEQEVAHDRLWRAHKHEVIASYGPTQYSCVFFSIPDHSAVLPNGKTVGKWVEERIARSRYER